MSQPPGSRQHDEQQKKQVKRGQDPQCSADVKPSVVLRFRLAVEQNSGYQKSRENKEQVNARPPS
jgi:hypothetical protein